MENFVGMQTDPIINVRLLIAETLSSLFINHETIGV